MTRYTRSPYEILGISVDATRKDIKKRYRLLAKRFHPDCASGDPEAEAKFKEIQWAYETLTVVGREKTTNGSARQATRYHSPGYEYAHPFSGFFWALKAYSSRIRHQKEEATVESDEAVEP